MTNTPETDELRDDIWASFYVEGSDFTQMFEHARKLERERDRLAKALILDWQSGVYPDSIRVVLATDGESIYVATFDMINGWEDAHTVEPIDYHITHWCELPELPEL